MPLMLLNPTDERDELARLPGEIAKLWDRHAAAKARGLPHVSILRQIAQLEKRLELLRETWLGEKPNPDIESTMPGHPGSHALNVFLKESLAGHSLARLVKQVRDARNTGVIPDWHAEDIAWELDVQGNYRKGAVGLRLLKAAAAIRGQTLHVATVKRGWARENPARRSKKEEAKRSGTILATAGALGLGMLSSGASALGGKLATAAASKAGLAGLLANPEASTFGLEPREGHPGELEYYTRRVKGSWVRLKGLPRFLVHRMPDNEGGRWAITDPVSGMTIIRENERKKLLPGLKAIIARYGGPKRFLEVLKGRQEEHFRNIARANPASAWHRQEARELRATADELEALGEGDEAKRLRAQAGEHTFDAGFTDTGEHFHGYRARMASEYLPRTKPGTPGRRKMVSRLIVERHSEMESPGGKRSNPSVSYWGFSIEIRKGRGAMPPIIYKIWQGHRLMREGRALTVEEAEVKAKQNIDHYLSLLGKKENPTPLQGTDMGFKTAYAKMSGAAWHTIEPSDQAWLLGQWHLRERVNYTPEAAAYEIDMELRKQGEKMRQETRRAMGNPTPSQEDYFPAVYYMATRGPRVPVYVNAGLGTPINTAKGHNATVKRLEKQHRGKYFFNWERVFPEKMKENPTPAQGFQTFHNAAPDRSRKIRIPRGWPRKLWMLGRLEKLVLENGQTISGGTVAAGTGNRIYILNAHKRNPAGRLATSARAKQIEYVTPSVSERAGPVWFHPFDNPPLVREVAPGFLTLAGKGIQLTRRGIVG